MNPGFILEPTDDHANVIGGKRIEVSTEHGILLQLPRDADIRQAKHLLAIARENAGTPVDLVVMRGNTITWSARVTFNDNRSN